MFPIVLFPYRKALKGDSPLNKKEYFLFQLNENKELCFKEDGCYYFPAKTWTNAAEGLVSNIEVVELFKDEYDRQCAYVSGTMVPTIPFNFHSDLALKVKDLVVVGATILVQFDDSKDYYEYYARLDVDEFVPVHMDKNHDLYATNKESLEQLHKITTYIKETQSCMSKTDAITACINHFKELELHGADEISVYDDCIFFVGYPGWYRDTCTSFYITENDKVKRTHLGVTFAKALQQNNAIKLSGTELFSYMQRHNISAGEDSGHEIPNLPEEYRNMFVTKELKSGGIYVSLNADNFFPELLQNETIMAYVDDPIGPWMVLEGEYCSYAHFFD